MNTIPSGQPVPPSGEPSVMPGNVPLSSGPTPDPEGEKNTSTSTYGVDNPEFNYALLSTIVAYVAITSDAVRQNASIAYKDGIEVLEQLEYQSAQKDLLQAEQMESEIAKLEAACKGIEELAKLLQGIENVINKILGGQSLAAGGSVGKALLGRFPEGQSLLAELRGLVNQLVADLGVKPGEAAGVARLIELFCIAALATPILLMSNKLSGVPSSSSFGQLAVRNLVSIFESLGSLASDAAGLATRAVQDMESAAAKVAPVLPELGKELADLSGPLAGLSHLLDSLAGDLKSLLAQISAPGNDNVDYPLLDHVLSALPALSNKTGEAKQIAPALKKILEILDKILGMAVGVLDDVVKAIEPEISSLQQQVSALQLAAEAAMTQAETLKLMQDTQVSRDQFLPSAVLTANRDAQLDFLSVPNLSTAVLNFASGLDRIVRDNSQNQGVVDAMALTRAALIRAANVDNPASLMTN